MLLQRKSTGGVAPGGLTASLARGVRSAMASTLDRRAFLKRSGVGAGAWTRGGLWVCTSSMALSMSPAMKAGRALSARSIHWSMAMR